MSTSFITLFNVSFSHEYFADNLFKGFRVNPAGNTAGEMLENGFLFKAGSNGFSVYFDKHAFGTERAKYEVLKNELKLEFFLELTDHNFYNYTTHFNVDISKMIFQFTNLPGMSCQAEKGVYLHRDEYASAKDTVMRGTGDKNSFGKVTILMDNNLHDDYIINFESRRVFLRYFLVSNHLLELNQPAIVDSTGQQKFSEASEVTMTNGQKARLFISENVFTLKNIAHSNCNLVENFEKETGKSKTVRSGLPLPDIHSISRPLESDNNSDKLFADIFI